AICAREGLVTVDLVAGDGTKVKASASKAASRTLEELDVSIDELQKALKAEVTAWWRQADLLDEQDEQAAADADRAPGGGLAAEPPMEHHARDGPIGQLVKELIGCPVAVQTRDPRFAGENVQCPAQRLQLPLKRHLGPEVQAELAHEGRLSDERTEGSRIKAAMAPHHARVTADAPDNQVIMPLQRRASLGKRAGRHENDRTQAPQLVWRDANVDVGVQIQWRQGGIHRKSSSSSAIARSQMSRAAAVV
ncbi:MAG TPA: hypothetical protein VMV92_08870, partial [Streptosporangiaceae bacterium]|nr:hypothetical protein [Streptosporangiaceae bacterium]